MKLWSRWILAACVVVVVIAGIGFLLWRRDPVLTHSWWTRNSSNVIKFAVPAAAALLARISQQVFSARLWQSTPEQLEQAREHLAGRGREWWRRVPQPAWPGHAQRAALTPLDVEWASVPAGPVHGSVRDIATLAGTFRDTRPCRLVIRGDTGSGKSVLARLLMAELLKRREPGDPVPVFLPLASWDPRRERLHDWMKRRIAEDAPELQDETTYGPTAVANLIDQGMVLPILDGLDSLPQASRLAVLANGELLSQDRFVLTCRTGEFDTISGFTVIVPQDVHSDTAVRFLREVTDCPAEWDVVGQHLREHPDGPAARALAKSRTILLASVVYGTAASLPGELTDEARFGTAEAIGGRLLEQVIPALMPADDSWARNTPWYRDQAVRWLTTLAKLDLRVSDMPAVTWWNLHRGIAWLNRWQAPLRGLVAGLIVFGLCVADFRRSASSYALMTSGGYALAVFVACLVLGDNRAGEYDARDFRRPALLWWLGDTWARSRRVLAAGLAGMCLFGAIIGLRTAWLTHHDATATGARTGLWDGVTIGLTIMFTFIIARAPAPPRSMRARDRDDGAGTSARALARAVLLGIPFGLLWGVTAVIKHQHAQVPAYGQAIPAGLITGLDFVVGCWLFAWSQIWFKPGATAGPRSAARIDLAGAMLRPLILGATFAFAFGLSAPFNFTSVDVVAWFIVGTVTGYLASQWPLYAVAVTWLAFRRELPLRLLKFLDCCRERGVLRAAGMAYQFQDDALRERLRLDPAEPQAGPPAEPPAGPPAESEPQVAAVPVS